MKGRPAASPLIVHVASLDMAKSLVTEWPTQAEQLARALAERGAHVEADYFPTGAHELGRTVDLPLRNFLRDNLLGPPSSTP